MVFRNKTEARNFASTWLPKITGKGWKADIKFNYINKIFDVEFRNGQMVLMVNRNKNIFTWKADYRTNDNNGIKTSYKFNSHTVQCFGDPNRAVSELINKMQKDIKIIASELDELIFKRIFQT